MTRLTVLLVFAVALLMGCQQAAQQTETPAPVQVERPKPPPEPIKPPPPPPPPDPTPIAPDPRDQKLIFFDFDRSDIKPEFRGTVTAHSQYLADSASTKVRLEGHADERGSREYNIGLGERRAQSVRQAMMLQGVRSAQIETLSYGEERPLDSGKGEYAWSQNRRVKIVYLP